MEKLFAATGYLTFLLAAFGYRTIVAAGHGDSGWRRPVSRIDAVGETTCAVGCLLSFLGPVLSAVGAVPEADLGYSGVRLAAGALLLVSGAIVSLSAQAEMGSNWRAGVEASPSLVVTGLFRWIRNPFYLGCILAAFGAAVAAPTIVGLLGVGAHLAAALVIVLYVEEPMLEEAHGRSYVAYRQRSGRFLPRMLPRRPA